MIIAKILLTFLYILDVPQGGVTTCSYGAAECHSKAECVNHPTGFCCICQDGYYGNGKNCLQDGNILNKS